jgi:inositol oxygenase
MSTMSAAACPPSSAGATVFGSSVSTVAGVKRPRERAEEWRSFLLEEPQNWGLEDLFGGKGKGEKEGNGFYTLRLEHREGGAVARHQGEERILLFRSDRPGAIAKIVYSSNPAPFLRPGKKETKATESEDQEEAEECEFAQMAQAKIHVLDVKEPYRGVDLGSLLFSEAVASLKHRYRDELERDSPGDAPVPSRRDLRRSSVNCRLDAEEDCRRHNKLVHFYESLGCRIKPRTNVQYIHNNDGEMYRKVPMRIALRAEKELGRMPSDLGSLLGRHRLFVPIAMEGPHGDRICLPITSSRGSIISSSGRFDWLLMEDGEGMVEIHTTKGQRVRVLPCGEIQVTSSGAEEDEGPYSPNETLETSSWSKFHLIRVGDSKLLPANRTRGSSKEGSALQSRENGLWLLQSWHGTFLSIDEARHHLCCLRKPSFWQATFDGRHPHGSHRTLTCTTDTPHRRHHYLLKWQTQTVDYVKGMHKKYLDFRLCAMTLKEALDRAKYVKHVNAPSVRSVSFRTAEWFRSQGHPDWVQAVVLMYSLASVLRTIDGELSGNLNGDCDNSYDWTVPSRSWIVGCSSPASVISSEFRSLNKDNENASYNSLQGMYDAFCGLDQVFLTWSGPEYMAELCRHNGIGLPEEALALLRLASFSEWHTKKEYMQLASSADRDIMEFVADFDMAMEQASCELADCEQPELSDAECDQLWESCYRSIVEKYGAGGVLQW